MNLAVLYLKSQLGFSFHQIYSILIKNHNAPKSSQIRYFQKCLNFLNPFNYPNILQLITSNQENNLNRALGKHKLSIYFTLL